MWHLTKENVKGTGDSDRMEADMVSLLYISEPNSFRWCLVSLFWLSFGLAIAE